MVLPKLWLTLLVNTNKANLIFYPNNEEHTIEQCVLDTNAGKQLSYAAKNVSLILVLKKMS